jgi:AraC family transcriptional regulator, transcriptional activator of pobA
MQSATLPTPFIETITDFFQVFGLGLPFHPEIMCMRLEEKPDSKVVPRPLYRVNFFRVIHLYQSALDVIPGDTLVPTPQNYIRFGFPGKLESWSINSRVYGYAIYFTPTFAGLDVTDPTFDETYPYFNEEAKSTLLLNQVDAQTLKTLSDEMIDEGNSSRVDKWIIIQKLLHLYLAKVRRFYLFQSDDSLPATTRTHQALFYRFRAELDTYFQELITQKARSMPSVSVIAQRMSINANYLNSSIKKTTGRTASSYIQDKLMLEAKAYLLHSDSQIAEIAYNLGFEHVSYFNRFFRKHAQCAPVEFRNSLRL